MSYAALLIQEPDGALREVPLLGERVVLGRDPSCDLVIAGRLISRQHACITRAGQAYTIEDLGSRNGTMVNGQPIDTSRALRDGDRIDLGGLGSLTFLDGDATSTRPIPAPEGIWLDVARQDVWVDGQRLSPRLSPAQFSLLQTLVAHVDQICSRQDIVEAVWPTAADGVSDEAIDALIKRIRARLGEVPGGARYLTTLRGRGVMLRSPASLRRS
ncbi:MAG TPA: FHA domain-containing protein [Roseiflexaceae bacterium]